jgi:hypothetical protein
MIATPTAQSQANDVANSRDNIPPIAPPDLQTSTPKTVQTSAPKQARSVTRNEKSAKSSELRLQRTRKPKRKRAAKPPAVTPYHWRQHGAGWDLRKDVYVTSHDGVRKRKQPYVAHLSREAFG